MEILLIFATFFQLVLFKPSDFLELAFCNNDQR